MQIQYLMKNNSEDNMILYSGIGLFSGALTGSFVGIFTNDFLYSLSFFAGTFSILGFIASKFASQIGKFIAKFR